VIFIVLIIFRNAVQHGWHVIGFFNILNVLNVGNLCFSMRLEHSELCTCWKLVLWHAKAFVSVLNTRKNQQF